MAITVKLIAPVGVGPTVNGVSSATYTLGSDRSVTVANIDVPGLLAAGFALYSINVLKSTIIAPLPADLVSIVAAATPANGAATIAAQPIHARKLQYRIVIGTTTTTAITAGTATVTGLDQDGNAISEVVSLIQNASATVKSAYAWSSITSIVIAGYAANGSGTGNTFGVGVSNDFGLPSVQGLGVPTDFALIKATKIVNVLGTSVTASDDVASTATVDPVARSVAPTTAPAANGLNWYEFTYSYDAAA
jgi:hypothetical protein